MAIRSLLRSNRLLQLVAVVSGLLAVMIGAAGAHGPLAPTRPELEQLLATATLFHISHSLALMQFGLWRDQNRQASAITGWLFALGMLLFVGTLDWHVFSGARIPGPWTPIGGAMLMSGWVAWGVQILRHGRA